MLNYKCSWSDSVYDVIKYDLIYSLFVSTYMIVDVSIKFMHDKYEIQYNNKQMLTMHFLLWMNIA